MEWSEINKFILPGNCFIWAIILRAIYGGKIFHVLGPFGPEGQEVKHYMVRDKTGTVRHFKRVADFLPKPFCYYMFLGTIERSGKRRVKNARKNISSKKNIQTAASEETFDTVLA